MLQSSPNDIFRFLHLRATGKSDNHLQIDKNTSLAKSIAAAESSAARRELADAFLTDSRTGDTGFLKDLKKSLSPALEIIDADVSNKGGLVEVLREVAAKGNSRTFNRRKQQLSDLILASMFASKPPDDSKLISVLFRLVNILSEGTDGIDEDAIQSVFLPIGIPVRSFLSLTRTNTPGNQDSAEGRIARNEQPSTIAPLMLAMEELSSLEKGENLTLPGSNTATAFAFNQKVRKQFSPTTKAVLAERRFDSAEIPAHELINNLATELNARIRTQFGTRAAVRAMTNMTGVASHVDYQGATARARPAGVADLLVVKQQIQRYELGEVAHIQSVLAGEKFARSHRRLDREEETWSRETERVSETQSELHSTERFELNRETSRTLNNDQKVGFGLSLSGKYGPAVEFESNLDVSHSQSSNEQSKNASDYAREVVSRSVERIAETVREQRSVKLIRETEETNLHELTNDSDSNRRGFYQFLDKVYVAQVFNYGIRQMFEFMVPEPASYLWHLETSPETGMRLPEPPPRLESVMPYPSSVLEQIYPVLTAIYRVPDVDPPPPYYKMITGGVSHGDDGAKEGGQPRSVQSIELGVPEGYRAERGLLSFSGLTDNVNEMMVTVNVGHQAIVWNPHNALNTSKLDLAHESGIPFDLSAEQYDLASDSKLKIQAIAYETNSYTANVNLVCRRTDDALREWRMATYDKIVSAYQDRLREYQLQVDKLKAAAAADTVETTLSDAPPTQNLTTIRQELKKHCLSIAIGSPLQGLDAIDEADGAPPAIDFVPAKISGAYIRFFEQAFEWDQMQYVFYPYFWARGETWADRFLRQDADPEYRDFLRAGSARVVVPVRPGFEAAVGHFFTTGDVWNGEGSPPSIGSELYVPIVQEIMERRGTPQQETPVGDPWEVRVPTSLIALRMNDSIPRWKRADDGQWLWEAEPENDAATPTT